MTANITLEILEMAVFLAFWHFQQVRWK